MGAVVLEVIRDFGSSSASADWAICEAILKSTSCNNRQCKKADSAEHPRAFDHIGSLLRTLPPQRVAPAQSSDDFDNQNDIRRCPPARWAREIIVLLVRKSLIQPRGSTKHKRAPHRN